MARILPGGLTSIQNEFMKLRLQNNPEFAAKYFPNVVLHPPSGPLYNVDLPGTGTMDEWFGPAPGTTSPKAIYQTTKPTKPGPFDYMELEHPTKGAQFTAENVSYDTPNSVLDLQASNHPHSYAYTIPSNMNQDVGSYHLGGGGEGEYSEPSLVPITGGQSSTIFMNPEMIEAYGTDPKAPRNERVPAPNWWPDKKATHVNQDDINQFIEEVSGHEVSHNVSYLPEYEGINALAQDLDFQKMFPPGASKEAQAAIEQLNILNEVGGAVYAPAKKYTKWSGDQYDYPPPDARSIKMGFSEVLPEPVNPKYTTEFKKRIEPFNLEPEYESTLLDYDVDEEELYNRAKDIYKIKMQFPNNYQKNMAYINNMNFINSRLSKMPKKWGTSDNKAETYLKNIEPAVTAYIEKITGGGREKWSPGVGASQRGSNAPGFTDPGKGSYGPWKADGGLATMFERRR